MYSIEEDEITSEEFSFLRVALLYKYGGVLRSPPTQLQSTITYTGLASDPSGNGPEAPRTLWEECEPTLDDIPFYW